MTIPVHSIHWNPSWRVIPTRYPEVNLYERIAGQEETSVLNEIENLTNNRVRLQTGAIQFLRPEDHFTRGCSTDVLASFAYGRDGRFTKADTFGAFYVARSLKTAAFEKAHHYMQFLMDAHLGPLSAQMRVIKADIKAAMHDIRGLKKKHPELYRLTNYTSSQTWAQNVWRAGAEGIVYDSVRNPGGQCAALFSPQKISHCHKDRILTYSWDGIRTISISPVEEFLRFERR